MILCGVGCDAEKIRDGDDGAWAVRRRTAKKGGCELLAAVVSRRTVCLRKIGGGRAGEMRYGRLLHNPAVTVAEMIETAALATGERAAGRRVLVVQDTTEINLQAHVRRKRGFGTVGNGVDIGLLLHPQLVLDAGHGGILGIAGAEIVNRAGGKVENRKARPLEDKESRRWLAGMETARRVLRGADEVTVVGDRESDIFGLFASRGEGPHLLVRAAQNRTLATGGLLFGEVLSWPVAERYPIDVPAKSGEAARQAIVALRYGPVGLKRQPRHPKNWPERVDLHAVSVIEEEPPEGKAPVHWLLLTSHRVDSLETACDIVVWYKMRWTIEQLFRTMKSQCLDIEQSQIVSAGVFAKLLAVALIAAAAIMQLIHARDGRSGQCLEDAVNRFDRNFLAAQSSRLEGKTEKQKNPHPPDTLAFLAWIAGRLGGWSGYASKGYKPPGPKTMHDGLQQLEARYQGWRIAKCGQDV